MNKKITVFILMMFTAISPYYEFMLYDMQETKFFTDDIIYIMANCAMVFLPALTAFLAKSKKQRVLYFLICVSVLALGDYTYNILFVLLKMQEWNVQIVFTVAKTIVIITKVILSVATFVICEYIYEEKGVIKSIARKLKY